MPYLALLSNALIWGLSWWPFRRLNEHGLHSLWATVLIYAIAVICITFWRPVAWTQLLRHPGMIWIFAASGVNNAAFNWAVQEGEVVRVVLLFYLMPVWAALLARWLLKEAITRYSLIQIGLALCGAMLVLWRPEAGLPVPRSLHDWLGLLGGVCFAAVNVLLRRHADTPNEVRALAMFGGACVVAAGLALALGPSGRIAYPPAPQAGWILGLVVFASFLLMGNLGLQYGAARLPAQTTALVMLSEIIFASASAILISNETLSPYSLLGGCLILASAVLSALGSRARARVP